MPRLSRRSYAETIEGRRRLLSQLKLLFFIFLGYELITGLFLASFVVASASMSPTILAGERILASPLAYGPHTLFGKLPGPARPARGDLVLLDPPYADESGFWSSLGDSLVRFLTLQRISIAHRGKDDILGGPLLERVIALPGDTVLMEDFVFKVKPAGQAHFLTEFELSDLRYDIEKPELPEGWKDSFPLSGHMASRVLGKDEYFLAGDDRGSSSDSRYWGPLSLSRFRAKVLLRYWPLSRLGNP